MLLPKDIPQKLASFVQFSPILRWCATSCVDVWNRPWRWFGTWWPLRILEANAFHGDGQKCKQNGHKLIWPKNTAEIMSECNLCESWFFLLIPSVVGVGYSQLVMFFDYQETICCTVLGIKTQGKRIKTCLFRKIFSCFCACLVKWEIPPISEVSKNSFPPRLSPRRRFCFLCCSCWFSCPKHQGWLTSTPVILTFFKLEPFQASFEQEFWAKFFRRWEVWRDVLGEFLAVKISR